MTPTLTDLMAGQAVAIAAPQPPEAGGDYLASRLGMIAMIASLSAQEAERGPAARIWENTAIQALLDRARHSYEKLATIPVADDDFTWSGLDRRNAGLRKSLISVHEAAEVCDDTVTQSEILNLYVAMAEARRLALPSALD
jgi:hypothetical protein